MGPWRERLRQIRRYPSALAVLTMIAALIALSLYAVIAIPYGQALELWRGGEMWRLNPVNAAPVWADRLVGGDLPRSIVIGGEDANVETEPFPGGRLERIALAFD